MRQFSVEPSLLLNVSHLNSQGGLGRGIVQHRIFSSQLGLHKQMSVAKLGTLCPLKENRLLILFSLVHFISGSQCARHDGLEGENVPERIHNFEEGVP